MATEPDSTLADAVPVPNGSESSLTSQNISISGIDDDALDNDSLDAYSDEEQKQATESSQGQEQDAAMSHAGDDAGNNHDDDSDSSLSSPPSSPDEALLETTTLPEPDTQNAKDSPSMSHTSAPTKPNGVATATATAAAAAVAAAVSPAVATAMTANPDATQATPSLSGLPSAQTPYSNGVFAAADASGSLPPPSDLANGATTTTTTRADTPASVAEVSPETKPSPAQAEVQADAAREASAPLAEDSAPHHDEAAEAEPDEPGIDIDKMLDAISADAPPRPPPPTHPLAAGPMSVRADMPYLSNPMSGPMPAEKPASIAYVGTGAPGTAGGLAVLGSPPSSTATPLPKPPAAPRQANNPKEKAAVDRAYQEFLQEERRYMSDANWEKFPDGSRMFIGNLSQERVSKRDVFEAFHRYGRLAQISIKSAYGFVQYHTAAEAQNAMQNLQGSEIRGRKIHLELSKTQKKEKERERSPSGRKSRGGRGADRYDGREHGNRRSRDDYRPGTDGRDASPRRDRGRDDHYSGRDRSGRDSYRRHSRDRSRSPNRSNGKSYRSRHSPSPYGRNRNDSVNGFDGVKSRQGNDVPDVQFLVTQGLERNFIKWVQSAFTERSMRTNIMLMTPHSPPRNTIIQTQVLEGVTAVVDLDVNSQTSGKISLQVFDRSAGTSNVRFDGYQDLPPPIAADVVLRAKATAASQHLSYPAANSYGQQYPGAAPTQGYPSNYQAPAPAAAAPAQPSAYDLASLMGQLDSAGLSQLLGALQTSQAAPAAPAVPAHTMPYGQSAAPQLNLNAILGSLAASTSAPAVPSYGAPAPYSAGIPSAPAAAYPAVQQGANDQTIQAIMAQLAKYKQ